MTWPIINELDWKHILVEVYANEGQFFSLKGDNHSSFKQHVYNHTFAQTCLLHRNTFSCQLECMSMADPGILAVKLFKK